MGQLYDITPFTLLDFPGETACVAWFAGCNLRCVYCHNPDIVEGRGARDVSELLDFLKTRVGKLSGVVFSGGEATYYPELVELARQVRDLGYKIKLDTNGARPDVLRELLGEGLLDYVALDYKCLPEKAEALIGTGKFVEAFRESLGLLIEAAGKGLAFEVRTTVHADLMDEDEIGRMIGELERAGYRGTYYLQNVISFGEKTIGNVARPERVWDNSKLPEPKGFKLGFRNFDDPSPKSPGSRPGDFDPPARGG